MGSQRVAAESHKEWPWPERPKPCGPALQQPAWPQLPMALPPLVIWWVWAFLQWVALSRLRRRQVAPSPIASWIAWWLCQSMRPWARPIHRLPVCHM